MKLRTGVDRGVVIVAGTTIYVTAVWRIMAGSIVVIFIKNVVISYSLIDHQLTSLL